MTLAVYWVSVRCPNPGCFHVTQRDVEDSDSYLTCEKCGQRNTMPPESERKLLSGLCGFCGKVIDTHDLARDGTIIRCPK